MATIDNPDSQTYYHGTKADLRVGDLIEPGYSSNYGKRKQATFVYLTGTLDAAIWGAELAVIPVLLGKGLPLLPDTTSSRKLRLINHRAYPKTGTVQLEYVPVLRKY